MTKKKKQLLLGLIVTLVGLGAFVHIAMKEDWSKTMNAFLQANYWLLIPSFVFLVLSMLFRAYRWRVFLHGHGEFTTGELFASTAIGFMGNSIFPARAGEFMRCILLAKKGRVPFLTVFATVGVERLFDLFAVIAFFAVTLWMAPFPPGYEQTSPAAAKLIRDFGQGAVLFLVVMLIAILLMTFKPELFKTLLRKTVGLVLPEKFFAKIIHMVDPFVNGLSCLRSLKLILLSLFWSVLVWFAIGYSEYLIFVAFTDQMGMAASFLVMAIVAFAVAAPSTPGYLGIYDVVCQTVLIGMFQIETAVATSSTLILHASQLFPVILLGFVCAWVQGLSFRELQETEKLAEEEKDHTGGVA